MNAELKMKIQEAYRLADDVSVRNPGLIPNGSLSLREMLKFDLLQFLGFLYESDGNDGTKEAAFVTDQIGIYMDVNRFIKFRYDRCLSPDFINTVPRSMNYFAKADLSGSATWQANGKSISRIIADLIGDVGTEFVAINGSSVSEISNLSNYSLMLNNFLKQYGLYNTGKPGDVISAGTIITARRKAIQSGLAKPSIKKTGNQSAGAKTTDKPDEPEQTLDQLMEELNSLVGLDAVKQDLTNLINLIKIRKMREERGMKQPSITLHLVFSGNPGTGKTTVARLLAKIYKALGVVSGGQLVEVDRSNLVAGYIGQTATLTSEVIDSALGGILFIDEAYTLTDSKDSKDFGQEAVNTLLKRMEDERENLIVIVAGYTDKMEEFISSNPGLKSRFNKNIFFRDYSGEELTQIFLSMCEKQEYAPDAEAKKYISNYLTERAEAHEDNFANAREARNYLERCIERQASRLVGYKKVNDKQLKTLNLKDVTEEVQEE